MGEISRRGCRRRWQSLAVLYIMLGRIYDMLILLADASGKGEDALQLINLHSQGQLMSPPPSLMLEDEDEPSEQS